MTATEQALEKVKQLGEGQARELLRWLGEAERTRCPQVAPVGTVAMLGCARRFHPEPRITAQWLHEFREGES